MHNTAYEIMHWIMVVLPLGYEKPSDQKAADRDRAKFIFEQQPDLMSRKGFKTPEELVQKYWNDPHGQLPRASNEA